MASKRSHRDQDKFASMVLLMGSTGSGKSFFINKLKENATIESSSLYSCTATCQVVQTRIGRTNLAVVDCPGFNDTKRSDTEILGEIAKVLSSQYLLKNKLRLRGILYLRDITKTRMEGSDVKTLNLFSKLVGEKAFPHVIFVTTMWGRLEVTGSEVAYRRERELKENFWREMIEAGSYVQRFKGTKDSAEGIISQLIGDADPVTLQIQHELIDKELRLSATAAGSVLVSEVDDKLGESKSKLQRFRSRLAGESNSTVKQRVMIDIEKAEQEHNKAQSDKDKLEERVGAELKAKINEEGDWQNALRTICSVVGVSLTIVVNSFLETSVSDKLLDRNDSAERTPRTAQLSFIFYPPSPNITDLSKKAVKNRSSQRQMASHISEKIPPRVSSIQKESDEMSRNGPPVPPKKFSTDSRVPTGELRAGSPCSQNDTDASTMSKSGQLTDSEKVQRNRLRRGRSKQPQPRGESEEQSSKRGIREKASEKAKKYFPGMNSANQKNPQDLAKEPVARQIPGSLQPGMSREELMEEIQALRRDNDELRRGKPSPTSNAFPVKTESRGVDTSDLTNISTVQEKFNPGHVMVRLNDWNDRFRELKDVKEQLALYESKMDGVFEELAAEKSKRVEAQRKAKATLKELASVTKTEGNFFDDSHFRDAVIKLRYDVRSWARNQGWQEQPFRSRDSNKVLRPYLFLRDTCDTFAEYIKSALTLPWLMEAYLWQYLLSQVFGRYVWAESHNASLYGLNGRALNAMMQWKDTLDREFNEESDYYETFQNWRVAACRILAVRREVDIAAAIRRRLDDIRKILRPICINGAVDESGLTEIFRDAIGLDMLLQQERPDYTFYPRFSRSIRPEGLNYQPDSMEVENEDELAEIPEHLRRVKLVIQPSLQKYGNSAGRNYQDGFSVLDTVVHISRMRDSRY